MRTTLIAKLVVLLLAAIALVYGISLVMQINPTPVNGQGAPKTLQASTPNVVVQTPSPAAQVPQIAPMVAPQSNNVDSVEMLVNNAVQSLEEGDGTRSLLQMRLAIDAAKSQNMSPAQLDALNNMLMRIEYCEHGAASVLTWLDSPEAALVTDDRLSPVSLDRSRLKIEALLALGKLQESWDESKLLLDCFAAPGAAQVREPLALEQAIRIAGTAGATDQIPDLEKRLRAAVEAGITLKTLQDPRLPLATLGTLAKARGDCRSAIKLYDQALEGFDTNRWLREKRVAPWRMQVLVLVAMDRIDCLRNIGEIERSKGNASVLAADVATAFGDTDPIALQAADLRDQILYTPLSP